MREEDRQRIIQNIEKRKLEMRRLREETKELKQLEKNEDVIRYLKLVKHLKYQTILSLDSIKEQEFQTVYHNKNCPHDIFFYRGSFRNVLGLQREKISQFYEADPAKVEYYLYQCLDCQEIFEVLKGDNETFLKEHPVIQVVGRENLYDFRECYNDYCKLLCTNNADHARKKLEKKWSH